MTSQPPPIGCIDGRVVTVRYDADEIVLAFDEAEARLSAEAAKRLAAQLAPPSQSADSSSPLASSEEPPPKKPSVTKTKGTREKIIHLVEADLLHAGQVITLTNRGVTHRAQITAEGAIKIDGETFDTPSGAGDHVTKRSSDGWREWKIDGSPLDDLRWVYRAQTFLANDELYDPKTIAEKQLVARRWVRYALDHGLVPGKRDDNAVERFLSPGDYADTTLQSYRRHLKQWFEWCKERW